MCAPGDRGVCGRVFVVDNSPHDCPGILPHTSTSCIRLHKNAP